MSSTSANERDGVGFPHGERGTAGVSSETSSRKVYRIDMPGVAVGVIDSGVNPIPELLDGIDLTGAGDGDERGHGSAVAATILRGAPTARIVPIRVMDRFGALESPELLVSAFGWVRTNARRLGIEVVCAAFGDMSHSRSDERWRASALEQSVAALRAEGVAVVGAAGNWYPENRAPDSQGMAWPAILRQIVSVGEIERAGDGWKLGRVSQRLHTSCGTGCATTIFAEAGPPGETSGAAAAVAGRLAAIRMANRDETVEQTIGRLLAEAGTIEEDGLRWPALFV